MIALDAPAPAPTEDYATGAFAAGFVNGYLTMDSLAGLAFGIIVLLACITTSVGLIGATSAFFNKLIPALSYKSWAIIFTLIAFVLASFGLQGLMSFAIPVITTLYPPALTLVILTLVAALVGAVIDIARRGSAK